MSNSITAEELKTIKEQQSQLSTVVNQIGHIRGKQAFAAS